MTIASTASPAARAVNRVQQLVNCVLYDVVAVLCCNTDPRGQ